MLQQKDCNLRLLKESDLEQVLNWRNSERIRANMYNDHVITEAEHFAWFGKLQTNPNCCHLIFEYQGVPIGVVNITQIDNNNNRCYWGFYLGVENTPPGCGLVMGYYGLDYIFDELHIRKLCSEVLAFNFPSLKYQLKLGFVEEGCFKEHILKNGIFEDIVCLALFANVWQKTKDTIALRCFGGKIL
jgi:UDP-4-amino-4,6-dideoxy-N-acetyl-beta-L-altrosamine N-acetyltransferase